MPTAFSFSKLVQIADVIPPAKSVGAHLAAKLQSFCSDERTLTDELCDMLCIWLGIQSNIVSSTPSSASVFRITLSKTTSSEEVKTGADLELVVSSPLGTKRCLIQAKVLDPYTGKLRCDSKKGWNKLRKQLIAARSEAGDLAFLLVYIPGSLLSGNQYAYGSYEQSFMPLPTLGSLPSFFGATLIAVDDLLTPKGRWRTRAKVKQSLPGVFKSGIPFWRLLLELLLCRRSTWCKEELNTDRRLPAFRNLSIGVTEISTESWQSLQDAASQWLPERSENNDI
jgi:hypothetical protein